jgi:hypothetical protein
MHGGIVLLRVGAAPTVEAFLPWLLLNRNVNMGLKLANDLKLWE